MKKILAVVIVLLVAILMAVTVPDKKAHKKAMMVAVKEYMKEEATDKLGNNVFAKFGGNLASKAVEVALDAKLKEHNYLLLNTTYIILDDEEQLLSVGLLGHVFTFDKEMLREKLKEAAKEK